MWRHDRVLVVEQHLDGGVVVLQDHDVLPGVGTRLDADRGVAVLDRCPQMRGCGFSRSLFTEQAVEQGRDIEHVAVTVEVGDDIGHIELVQRRSVEDEGVVAGTAGHHHLAHAAMQDVVTVRSHDRQRIRIRAEDRIEADFHEVAGRSIREGEGASREDCLAIFLTAGVVGGERDAGDAVVEEARQLALVADAVVVGINPDLQLGEGVVIRIDNAVTIRIERSQSRHTACKLSAVEVRREDFRAVVDQAVAVNVIGQDAIVAGPGDLVRLAIGIDVEGDAVADR